MRKIVRSLITSLFIYLFSIQCFAQSAGQTIAFSVSDYEQSILTGEVIKPYYVPIPASHTNIWPYSYTKPTANKILSSSLYIIGGNNASRNEYPEFTLVLISNGVEIVGLCGGTLIARNKVLTAAHCAQESTSRYFVIPNFYSFNDNIVANDIFELSSKASHPNYNSTTFDNDVAVLTLDRSASTAKAKVHAGSNKFVGTNATAIGVGLTSTNPPTAPDILKEVVTPIVSNAACNASWTTLLGITPVTKNMMCAGFATNGNGSCSGDSGGPFWANIDGQRTLVGTVSFGINICELGRNTSVYARIGALNSFLTSQSPETTYINSDQIIIAPIVSYLLDEPVTP